MAFQPGEGWTPSGWTESCGISLFTLDWLDCSDPPRCLPIIGSGWIVNCDEQLFTLAWVCCEDDAIPGSPGHGGYLLKKKLFDEYKRKEKLKDKRQTEEEYLERLRRSVLRVSNYDVYLPNEEIPEIPDIRLLEEAIPLEQIEDETEREIALYMRQQVLDEIDIFVDKMEWLEMEMYFMLLAMEDEDF